VPGEIDAQIADLGRVDPIASRRRRARRRAASWAQLGTVGEVVSAPASRPRMRSSTASPRSAEDRDPAVCSRRRLPQLEARHARQHDVEDRDVVRISWRSWSCRRHRRLRPRPHSPRREAPGEEGRHSGDSSFDDQHTQCIASPVMPAPHARGGVRRRDIRGIGSAQRSDLRLSRHALARDLRAE